MSLTRKFHEGGLFFATMTVVGWQEVFSRTIYQDILIENLNFNCKNKGLRIFCYVIMPNHIHLIADSEEDHIGQIIQNFKAYTAKVFIETILSYEQEARRKRFINAFEFYGKHNNRKHQFWIHGSHPISLEYPSIIEQKRKYIEMNPVKAGYVLEPEHWRLSSANEDSPIIVEPGLV